MAADTAHRDTFPAARSRSASSGSCSGSSGGTEVPVRTVRGTPQHCILSSRTRAACRSTFLCRSLSVRRSIRLLVAVRLSRTGFGYCSTSRSIVLPLVLLDIDYHKAWNRDVSRILALHSTHCRYYSVSRNEIHLVEIDFSWRIWMISSTLL